MPERFGSIGGRIIGRSKHANTPCTGVRDEKAGTQWPRLNALAGRQAHRASLFRLRASADGLVVLFGRRCEQSQSRAAIAM